jgi:GNAT superfamily N-acetyltransferase
MNEVEIPVSVTIRSAERRDCPRLLELIRELAVFEREPDAVTVDPEHFEEMGFGNQPVWTALVAETGGEIVGFALCYIRYSTWKGARLYLEDILVTDRFRNRGIGTRLMEETIAYARRKGFQGMNWQVLDWNTEAIRFYSRIGADFDPKWINVSLEL